MTKEIANTLITINESNIPGEFKLTLEKADGTTFTTELSRAEIESFGKVLLSVNV